MLDKLVDTTLGGAGLCGENRLLLMDAPPAGTARENKLSGCSAGRAHSLLVPRLCAPVAFVWQLQVRRDPALGE